MFLLSNLINKLVSQTHMLNLWNVIILIILSQNIHLLFLFWCENVF